MIFMGDILVHEEKSSFYRIRVVEDEMHLYRKLYLDSQLAAGVSVETGENILSYADYVSLIFLLAPKPSRVLVVGLGGGVLPLEFHRKTNAKIDVVEIDPKIVGVAKKFFGFLEDDRMKAHVCDGREFVEKSREKYDVIFMDAFNTTYGIPCHLTTVELFGELKSHLSEDGFIVSNVISALEGGKSSMFRALYKTISQLFPTLYIFHSEEDACELQNIVIISTTNRKLGKLELFKRALKTPYAEFVTSYWEKDIALEDVPVLTDENCSIVEKLLGGN